jgi:purine-binding chemotaxis protein CheW
LLLGKKEEKQEAPKSTQASTQSTTPEPPKTEMTQVEISNQTIDDIPPELAAVFAEDQNGIAPTQIIREES